MRFLAITFLARFMRAKFSTKTTSLCHIAKVTIRHTDRPGSVTQRDRERGRYRRGFGSAIVLIKASTTSESGREASISIVADFLSNGSTVAL